MDSGSLDSSFGEYLRIYQLLKVGPARPKSNGFRENYDAHQTFDRLEAKDALLYYLHIFSLVI